MDDHPLESAHEWTHDIAREYGKNSSGEPLPREDDGHGRVWVVCTCGLKIPFKPSNVEE